MLLTKLVDAELSSGNVDVARRIAEKATAMVDIFDLWGYSRYTASYQIAEYEKNAEISLPLLEQMLKALTAPWSLTASVLYRRMAPETPKIHPQEMMEILFKEIETDPSCAYLREHPKYNDLIEKYAELSCRNSK